MTEQDYQLLSQYLDNELAPPQAQALRKRLMSEPALRTEFDAMKLIKQRLSAALDSSSGSDVPANVVDMVRNAAVTDELTATPRRAAWGFAVAASVTLAFGVMMNTTSLQVADNNPAMQLAQVMEQQPSRGQGWDNLADGSRIRPVLSFRSSDGDWCREYLMLNESNSNRGIACRANGNWNTVVVSEVTFSSGNGDYRPAGSADSDIIAAFIDNNAAGIALSSSEERALIENAWK
jgi:hypothetical protein